jgi:hypothetical protein
MPSSISKNTDRTGKVFLVLSNTECQCLVCGGVYSRDAAGAGVHAFVLCYQKKPSCVISVRSETFA